MTCVRMRQAKKSVTAKLTSGKAVVTPSPRPYSVTLRVSVDARLPVASTAPSLARQSQNSGKSPAYGAP